MGEGEQVLLAGYMQCKLEEVMKLFESWAGVAEVERIEAKVVKPQTASIRPEQEFIVESRVRRVSQRARK